ncbi:MAG: ribosome biogenesis GTP-binding protein YihA/YsxC [Myxococcaceae bacterium]
MLKVLDARFMASAVDPTGYPRTQLPEVAFAGRSNVGKSSMINALAGRRKLVRVSNTPGRTRTLNFFEVDLERDGDKRTLRLTDLPGYGFAKASKTERETWKEMISAYLEHRGALEVVVDIIDAEVGPTADDFQTLDYLAGAARKILVVATKIDRLPKARRKPRLKEIAGQLELPEAAVIPFSATEKTGVLEVWDNLFDALFRKKRPAG